MQGLAIADGGLVHHHVYEHADFDPFALAVSESFAAIGDAPLFTTDVADLFGVYLGAFPEHERQHHNCNCCRRFIQRFGGLVTIDATGHTTPAFWNHTPWVSIDPIFKTVMETLHVAVRRANVTGVFVSSKTVWGTPVTGEWTHLAVTPGEARIHRDKLKAPHEVMAQKKQDFGTLSHGLADFGLGVVNQALTLLKADALYRAEKVIGPAQFLHDLHTALAATPKNLHPNLIWRAVATAPVGFCTPRSSMVGTLMEDIAAGMSFDDVARRFKAKMNPLQYQRPQAPPAAGNIAAAEAIVKKLGIEASLRRRYAKIEDVQTIWKPAPAGSEASRRAAAGSVFAHLTARNVAAPPLMGMPAQSITWAKFSAQVLPMALKMDVIAPARGNYCGVLTACDPAAPPILQWDYEDNRNPVSWYVYSGGSDADRWGLAAGSWTQVNGVMLSPWMWGHSTTNHSPAAILIIEGARDRHGSSLGLFPEILKSELHAVRSTIEAHSQSGKAEGADEGTANGLMVGSNSSATVRVTSAIGTALYTIDRWD